MGLLDAYAAQADTGAQNPLVALPRTAGERFSAEFDAATAPDRWFNINGARRDWYQKTIDELHDQTGQTYLNPYSPNTPEEVMRLGNDQAIRQERTNKLIDANRALRETNPDAINAEGIDTFIGVAGQAAREKAASYVGTGNGMAAFAAGMVAPTPENILGLMIPPSKFLLGATTVGKSFLAGLGREALYQGATMGGLTAASEALDTQARTETGTAPTLSESVANVAASAAGGALFGGAFHALHAGPKALWEGWQGLHPDVRADAPAEVKDAFNVLEREAIYGDGNRFGIPWPVHDQLQTDTLRSILTGTPIRPVETTDTAMTALASMLRDAHRIDPEKLHDIVSRMNDQDVKGVARQLKPEHFAAADAIDQKLKELDEREAVLREEIPSSPESSPQRGFLGRSLGAVRDALDSMRLKRPGETDLAPEQVPVYRQIVAERRQALKKWYAAYQGAQNAIEDVRSRFDQIGTEALRPDVSPQPDLANAVQAAEFTRNARVLRENLPATRAAEAPRVPTPEMTPAPTAPEIDVAGLLNAKPAKEIRDQLMTELQQHETGVKESAAIKACTGGTA